MGAVTWRARPWARLGYKWALTNEGEERKWPAVAHPVALFSCVQPFLGIWEPCTLLYSSVFLRSASRDGWGVAASHSPVHLLSRPCSEARRDFCVCRWTLAMSVIPLLPTQLINRLLIKMVLNYSYYYFNYLRMQTFTTNHTENV